MGPERPGRRVTDTLRADVAIFGGGIAGLWLLARLSEAGYGAVLLEAGSLGGGQTLSSQGIIHGGTKYALTGEATASSGAVAEMPERWRACLAGSGELDLNGVRLLSPHQYLWSTEGVVSRVAGFFAGKLMRSRVEPVSGDARPAVFRHPAFHGAVYQLDEPVLDVSSLVHHLASRYHDRLLHIDWPGGVEFPRGADGTLTAVGLRRPDGRPLRLEAQRYVFTAGAGNEALIGALGLPDLPTQRRPLQMLMARGPLPELFAHCLGASTNPRVTVTSHPAAEGERVWYIGGQIAETGVERSREAQLEQGRRELTGLLSWVDFSKVRWGSFFIDRAEPRQPGGKRPDTEVVKSVANVMLAWPTKLALAPRLADTVLAQLHGAGIVPRDRDIAPLADWPKPPVGRLPWEDPQKWN